MYYILVTIIRRENDPAFFAHLTLGLFAFQLVGTSITVGDVGDEFGEVVVEYAVSAVVDSVVGGAYGVLPVPADGAGLFCVSSDFFDWCVVAEDVAGGLFFGDDGGVRHGLGRIFCGAASVFS